VRVGRQDIGAHDLDWPPEPVGINRGGFTHLHDACLRLADVRGIDPEVIAEAMAELVNRQVEFAKLKQRFDPRSNLKTR
jgi:hypothetical protein